MFKTTALAILAALITATTVLPSSAAILLPKPPKATMSDDCDYQLDYMARVSRANIEAINGQSIYLIPVCETGNVNDDYGWLFTSGNVGTLRQPIAQNDTLMAALRAQGYDQQDVISLRFGGGDSIVLYVHQRDLR